MTDNLNSIMGPTSRTAAYAYTAVGRVASGAGPWGNQTLTWDGGGNVATYDGMPFTVPSTSNQLASVSQLGTTQHTYSYLNGATGGGLLSQDVGLSSTYAYTYNAARRMTEVTLGGSANGEYAYDFAGRRVWRETFGSGAGQTAYTTDLDGHVQSESSATAGAPEREHIWLGDLLIGEVIWSGSTPALYAVTTGFIDDPQLMTNASGTSVWSIYMAPQGGSGSFGSTQTLPLRYPGQWSQSEVSSSSSNQNGMRDYQPYMGRYMTPDPLGIDAGPNPYTYVDGDPLNESDPLGLQVALPIPEFPPIFMTPPKSTEQSPDLSEQVQQFKHDCNCDLIYTDIDFTLRFLKWRYNELVLNRAQLPDFGPFSRDTHVTQYIGLQRRLQKLVNQAKYEDCLFYDPEADQWIWTPPPFQAQRWSPPNLPRPGG